MHLAAPNMRARMPVLSKSELMVQASAIIIIAVIAIVILGFRVQGPEFRLYGVGGIGGSL